MFWKSLYTFKLEFRLINFVGDVQYMCYLISTCLCFYNAGLLALLLFTSQTAVLLTHQDAGHMTENYELLQEQPCSLTQGLCALCY